MNDPKVGASMGAADPKQGMTLDELGLFVQQALKAGADGDTPVKVTMSWRSRLQQIEVG